MRSKKIEIDEEHRIYIFPKKIVYKEKKNGKFITKFSGVSISGLLSSPLIPDNIKRKVKEVLKDLS